MMHNNRNLYTWSALVALASLVLAVLAPASVLATSHTTGMEQAQQSMTAQLAPMIGTSPETAGAPVNAWLQLGPDEEHWYRFRSGENEEDTVPTTIELEMENPGCISFWVQTPERLRGGPDEDDDGVPEPLGIGSPAFSPGDEDDRNRSRLLWVGGADARSTFYVIVRNDTNSTCVYNLEITGPTVFFPDPDVQPTQQAMMGQQQAQQMTEQQMAAQQAPRIGTGPETAGAPLDSGVRIASGENHWYQFHSGRSGDDEDDRSIPVTVSLDMSAPGCVDFWVQSPERLRGGPDEDDDGVPEPLGIGSPAFAPDSEDDLDRSLLIWEGVADTTGTFYIIVRNQNGPACTYELSVEGPAVSF